MTITNAQIVTTKTKFNCSENVNINYTSKENVIIGSNIEIIFENTKHYFEVTDISIVGENLNVIAKEVGYWAHAFIRKPDFDLRNLIGVELTKVEAKDEISNIYEMSCWC